MKGINGGNMDNYIEITAQETERELLQKQLELLKIEEEALRKKKALLECQIYTLDNIIAVLKVGMQGGNENELR